MILLRPVDKRFPKTQGWMENPDLYPQTKGHPGVDYGCPEGTKIVAAADGEVKVAGLDPETAANPKAGYGNYVRIQSDAFMCFYGHMTQPLVKVGDMVTAGTPIGLSGNTGRSTGPHLHFEVRTGIFPGVIANPEPYIVDQIIGEGLYMMELTPEGDGLRIRTGPTTRNGIVRSLHTGDSIKILGVAGSDCWLLTPEGYVKFDPSWLKVIV